MHQVPTSISRRAIKLTVACLVLAALAFGSEAALAQEFELKVSHFLPPNHTFQKELTRWGDELEKASGGRLKLKLYPAAQLGPPQRQFDIVRSGVADISIGLTCSTPGRYPMTEIVSEAFVAPRSRASSPQ